MLPVEVGSGTPHSRSRSRRCVSGDPAPMHSDSAVFDDGRLGDHAAFLADLAWQRLTNA